MMKRFLIAPDSFKGTMAADEVCAIIADAIRAQIPDATIREIPLSDGGEGLVACFSRLRPLQMAEAVVSDIFGRPVAAQYGRLGEDGAVMEMASCAGLHFAKDRKEPLRANTYGVGELILHAAQSGARHITIGIGGSATTDCGVGMAAALGYSFLDEEGNPLEPLPLNMARVAKIQKPNVLPDIDVEVACDVSNPLYGENGAAYVFGPQKGADARTVELLDRGLRRMADIMERDLAARVRDVPGAGAAGGLGAALIAFLGARLRPGIDLLLDAAEFDALLNDTDLVFTGEGRIDYQSASGKVPVGVSRRAAKKNIPCIALCGAIGDGAEEVYAHGMTAIFSSLRTLTTMDELLVSCREDMRILTTSVIKTLLIQ